MGRLVVGISGASGAIYGIRLLQVLRDVANVETHLILINSAKFPFVAQSGDTPALIEQAMQGIRWYRITPDRLYLIDNSQGLGHRDEVPL